MEGKVAVIGNEDFVLPFSTLGLDTYPVEQDKESVINKANEIIENDYALVVLAENISETADEVFADVQDKPSPSVIVVPFTKPSEGFATRSLGKSLKRATGIDILKND
jgi:vacuolar-type H+-ATPase subunit F/Vma7